MLGGGQVLWVVGGALAGLGTAVALSLSDGDLIPDRADPPDAEGEREDPSDETTLPAGGAELMGRGYEVGDCVMWDPTEAVTVTEVVDCTEPHRIQIAGSVAAPDQGDYDVGQCVAYPPAAQTMTVVPCSQPHQWEITGRVDYTDQAEVPLDEADVRCHATAVSYLGGEPPEPWQYGDEGLSPESWAAGRRFSHCFLGQWTPDGSVAALSGSVRQP